MKTTFARGQVAGASSGAVVASMRGIAAVLTVVVLGWIYLTDLGDNPPGLFCDEAEIGVRTHQLLTGALPGFPLPLFYQHFAYVHLGTLPLYATAPFIVVLGVTDLAIRMAAAIWTVAGLQLLVVLARQVRWRNGAIGVAVFAASPIIIHIGRFNMGHAPSLFFTCAGLVAFARARERASLWWAAAAGIAMGTGMYGNAAYYLAAPVMVGSLAVADLIVSRGGEAWRRVVLFAMGFALTWVPIVVRAMTEARFLDRFRAKDQGNAALGLGERLDAMRSNYPKYFDFRYLFEAGEVGMPGGWLLRHSVPGAGLFPWLVLPLVLLGIVAIVRARRDTGLVLALAAVAMLVLYPIPDLVTTTSLNAPYTLAVYPMFIAVPLLAGYGIDRASRWREGRPGAWAWSTVVLPGTLLAVTLAGSIAFATGPYADYPDVAAGYYGWQYGSRQAVEEMVARRDGYDRYWLDPDFNEAYVFLDAYLVNDPDLRSRAGVGSLEQANLSRHDLYVMRKERFDTFVAGHDELRRYVRVVDTILYPSGEVAMVVVDVAHENRQPGLVSW